MGKTVAFVKTEDLLNTLMASYNDKSRAHEGPQLMERCRRVDLLILDDMGMEKMSEFTVKQMNSLIDMRYSGNKPLIMTSNFTPKELLAKFADKEPKQAARIASRLKEICY